MIKMNPKQDRKLQQLTLTTYKLLPVKRDEALVLFLSFFCNKQRN